MPPRTPFPHAINDTGEVVGEYQDTNQLTHAFIRSSTGTITTFDGPGANVTQAFSVNASGLIARTYSDSLGIHSFIRDSQGILTAFDVPGCNNFTVALGTNGSGQIAGYFEDSTGAFHSFIRDAAGNFTTFDAPGATQNRTLARAINTSGEVAGSYETTGFLDHGFVRDALGNFATFDAPAASQGTVAFSINDAGTTVGIGVDQNTAWFGFIRSASGATTVFRVSGAGRGSGQGTYPQGVNQKGEVTGVYIDRLNGYHGFLVQ